MHSLRLHMHFMKLHHVLEFADHSELRLGLAGAAESSIEFSF